MHARLLYQYNKELASNYQMPARECIKSILAKFNAEELENRIDVYQKELLQEMQRHGI